MDWLRYANQNATRNQPLDPALVQALSFLPEMGLSMEVFSGGQPAAGGGARVGSTRHDHGNAADAFFYQGDRRLDWANPDDLPIFEDIVRRGRAAGVTGFGAGDGYMRPGSMHIGFGSPGVWGAGGRGANASEWLRNAYEGGPAGSVQPTAVASADQQLPSNAIAMGGGPTPPVPDRANASRTGSAADEPWNFDETPLGQILQGKFDPKGMTKGGMGNALSMIAGGLGGNSTPAPSMPAPPPAHMPQVDPTFLSRIAMGR